MQRDGVGELAASRRQRAEVIQRCDELGAAASEQRRLVDDESFGQRHRAALADLSKLGERFDKEV